jgi:hypothetical protein
MCGGKIGSWLFVVGSWLTKNHEPRTNYEMIAAWGVRFTKIVRRSDWIDTFDAVYSWGLSLLVPYTSKSERATLK